MFESESEAFTNCMNIRKGSLLFYPNFGISGVDEPSSINTLRSQVIEQLDSYFPGLSLKSISIDENGKALVKLMGF